MRLVGVVRAHLIEYREELADQLRIDRRLGESNELLFVRFYAGRQPKGRA
jgi:hypothetical protein